MKIAYGISEKNDEAEAIEEALAKIKQELGEDIPQLVTVFPLGKKYQPEKIAAALKDLIDPATKVWGLNSDWDGVVAPDGLHFGITMIGFYAPDLVVGVGTSPFNFQDPASYEEVGKKAAEEALKDAGKQAGDKPAVVFLASLMLVSDMNIYKSMREVLGDAPICGGNAGQHSKPYTPGDGYTISKDSVSTNQISMVALWTKTKVGVAYGYSYVDVPEHKGIVTKADPAKQIIYEIDRKPAADVYNEWVGGQITETIKTGGMPPLPMVIGYPFKRTVSKTAVDYVTVGIVNVNPEDKSLFIVHEPFAEGEEISLVKMGTQEDFISKPAVTATVALHRAGLEPSEVAGALLVYCDALPPYAKAVGYDVNSVFPLISKSLGGAPFAGFLAGGEIGYSPNFGGESSRMMSCGNVIIVFGKD